MSMEATTRAHVRPSMIALASVAAMVAVLIPQSAIGATVLIDDVTMTGPGPTTWDAQNGGANSCNTTDIYTPVNDGVFGAQTDAFDGGLALNVEGTDFLDADESGDLVGNTLTVGSQTISGVKIWRTDRVLASSPTMRSLIKFKNPTTGPIRLTVLWDSNLGSDSSEAVRASANGDTTYALGDRWVVSSDDAVTPADPVLTFVTFGKRADVRPDTIVDTFTSGCFGVELTLKVKARSTKYLLFFTQMNGTNEAAISRAAKFNRVRTGSKLLVDLPTKVLNKISNWSFA